MDEYKSYMNHHWLLLNEGIVTIGMTEDGLEDVDNVVRITLPEEGDDVSTDEVIGEIYTPDGPVNIYAPVDGKVSEVNAMVTENTELLFEDPLGDGWLYKLEPNDVADLEDTSSEDDEAEDTVEEVD